MSENRIEAPQRVVEALKRAQETINRLQSEAEAMLFGVREALNVPDGWQWRDGGWEKPEESAGETQRVGE